MADGYVAALRRLTPWALALLGLAILAAATVSFVDSTGFGYDFLAYDAAARRLIAGEPLYLPGTAEAYNAGLYSGLFLYAPPLAVGLIPLTALSPDAATIAWLLGRIVLLGLGCAILPVRREVRLGLWFVATVSLPVLYDLNLGNVSVALFGLSAAMWRWNGTTWAGIALAAALSVRYSFGLVGIAWLLTRRWRAVVGSLVAGAVIVAVTLPFAGLAGWTDYLDILLGLDNVAGADQAYSLGSVLQAMGLGSPSSTIATFVGGVTALVAVALAARRPDPDLAIVVALAGTLLFAPFMKPPYVTALLIPAAYVANRGHWWGLALPLLGWLPGELLGLSAVLGVVAPLAVGPPRLPGPSAALVADNPTGTRT